MQTPWPRQCRKTTHVSVGVGVFGGAFGLVSGVAQGKHHRPLGILAHALQDLFVEGIALGRGTCSTTTHIVERSPHEFQKQTHDNCLHPRLTPILPAPHHHTPLHRHHDSYWHDYDHHAVRYPKYVTTNRRHSTCVQKTRAVECMLTMHHKEHNIIVVPSCKTNSFN